MKAKAILFDKDGTLLDFDALWLTITYKAVDDILKKVNQESIPPEEILRALGVENGRTDINGVLCRGTYAEMGQAIYGVLKGHGCDWKTEEVTRLTTEAYHRHSSEGRIKPDCVNLSEVLQTLKKRGILLAVVTTDDALITQKCLQALGIAGLFDAVYTDDGKVPAKPDPYCLHDFCKKQGLSAEEVVMVGDTLTDMRFAKNGGIKAVGIAKSERNKRILEDTADAVIPDISYIFDVLDQEARR